MTLNAPRTIPFDFRVFELDGIVWLFDDSSREYPCTATPHVYCEPLYCLDDSDLDGLDGGLMLASQVQALETVQVPLDSDATAPEVSDREAWDAAREEALANYLI